MSGGELSRSSLEYSLPSRLIAQEPLAERTSSRLLAVNIGKRELRDTTFDRLPDILAPGDLLVLNDTRVFRARLHGRRAGTGGVAEVFLLKRLDGDLWRAMVRTRASARPGMSFEFGDGLVCRVEELLDHGRVAVRFSSDGDTGSRLMQKAEVPLPPYIRRDPEELDDIRYQTVYASRTGAVAAPTAGLHFTDRLLRRLESGGIGRTFVTLHVGPGTFQPLRHERLRDNSLEPEEYHVPAESLLAMREARSRGGRIVAVGTTTTRILETIDLDSREALSGETDIFIFPPYDFRNVDALITNFHLPGSSLLCLVAAFMGYEFMMEAYRHAIEESYRFYSYGDAMFIERKPVK
ncbi:MAG: tRNA preQ1(34) S-adenosylmethionine ribosyltransferase-isomerase QueA [Candidatus Aegiribacteria sp.]